MGQFEHHVFVCTQGEYCPLQGSLDVHRALKEGVAARGLKKTVRVNRSGCLDQCGHGPMVVVYPDDIWYAGVTPETAPAILEHLAGGPVAEALRYQAPPGPNKNVPRMAQLNAGKAKPGMDAPTGGNPARES